MKKNIFLLIVLFSSIVTYSQDVLNIIAKETCECLDAKKLKSDNFTGDELKAAVGVCMIKSYSDHMSEFKADEKVKFTDKDGMTKLGETVGVKMLEICPSMILELGKGSKDDVKEEDAFVIGEVIDIKSEQFMTLQMKDQNGRNYSLLLLDYFDTASLLTNNEIKKKDKLKVSYTEIELFDIKVKEFRYFKILTKLEKQ
ncbi:hypothetical protein [Flavobacterium sp. MDT1-60]|uniref:hypothetical protein n=1 Tax=Flavobacterium sp. MDT1-60 TaxID=1979344 RepID=UPI001781B940|nr:hypothetical protein [Flavobacterium sp. MDT1-60]QOG04625.1 hypothetical protein IHE43_10630 [Flavobacterium sp. MDT1-60]